MSEEARNAENARYWDRFRTNLRNKHHKVAQIIRQAGAPESADRYLQLSETRILVEVAGHRNLMNRE